VECISKQMLTLLLGSITRTISDLFHEDMEVLDNIMALSYSLISSFITDMLSLKRSIGGIMDEADFQIE
jgi:hypothetical protein